MNEFPECGICGLSNNGRELFCYGLPYLKKVDGSWYGNSACIDCQQEWMERHTVICFDCGTSYITVNVGSAKRCASCANIYSGRVSAVSTEKKRTRDKGLSSTMSRADWIVTLDHFENKCAYCGGPYEVIEHFTPVKKGGGTDVGNCVPACLRCNSLKTIFDGRTQKEYLALRMNVPIGILAEIENYLNALRQ